MKTVNLLLWSVGVALQAALLVGLFLRGMVRRFPLFSLLIAFYMARSVLLYFLAGHIGWAAYGDLYRVLSWADLALQLLVLAEIAAGILRGSGLWSRLRGLKAGLAAFATIAASVALAAELPSRGPLLVDRGSVFTALLMLLLLPWTLIAGTRGTVRRIVEGLAAYGLVAVVATLLRSHAAVHRDASAWAAAAYAQSGVYLAAVVYWLFTVRRPKAPGAADIPAEEQNGTE